MSALQRNSFINRQWAVIVLNLLALAGYFAIMLIQGWPASLESTVFATIDARSYEAAGRMLLGLPTEFAAYDPLEYRPFLFSVLLVALTAGGSLLPFWALQFIAWMFAVNATWAALRKATGNAFISFTGALALAVHPGLISLSLHGLTEVITVALLAGFFWIWQSDAITSRKLLGMIAIAALLSVVRPVFVILLLFMAPMVFPMVRRHGIRYAGLALLMALPVLVQLGIIEARYGESFISRIGSGTLRNHLLSQVIAHTEGTDLETARVKAWPMSGREAMKVLSDHRGVTIRIYARNIADNIWNYSHSVNYPAYQNKLSRISLLWNQAMAFALAMSLLMLFLWLIFRRGKGAGWAWLPFFLSLLVMGSSGISFGEGDRLSMGALVPHIFLIAWALKTLTILWIRNR